VLSVGKEVVVLAAGKRPGVFLVLIIPLHTVSMSYPPNSQHRTHAAQQLNHRSGGAGGVRVRVNTNITKNNKE